MYTGQVTSGTGVRAAPPRSFSTFRRAPVAPRQGRIDLFMQCQMLDSSVLLHGRVLEMVLGFPNFPGNGQWLAQNLMGHTQLPDFLERSGLPPSYSGLALWAISMLYSEGSLSNPIIVRPVRNSTWKPNETAPVISIPWGSSTFFPWLGVPSSESGFTAVAPLCEEPAWDGKEWRIGTRLFATIGTRGELLLHSARKPVFIDAHVGRGNPFPFLPAARLRTPFVDDFLESKSRAYQELSDQIPMPAQFAVEIPEMDELHMRDLKVRLETAIAAHGSIVIKPDGLSRGRFVIFSKSYDGVDPLLEDVQGVLTFSRGRVIVSQEVRIPPEYQLRIDDAVHDWILRVLVTPNTETDDFQIAGLICCHDAAGGPVNQSLGAKTMLVDELVARLGVGDGVKEAWLAQIREIASAAGRAVSAKVPDEKVTLLGLDIMLDSDGHFKVLEVNGSNSGCIETLREHLPKNERGPFMRRIFSALFRSAQHVSPARGRTSSSADTENWMPGSFMQSVLDERPAVHRAVRKFLEDDGHRPATQPYQVSFHQVQTFLLEALLGNFQVAERAYSQFLKTWKAVDSPDHREKYGMHRVRVALFVEQSVLLLTYLRVLGYKREAVWLEQGLGELRKALDFKPGTHLDPFLEFRQLTQPIYQMCLAQWQLKGSPKWRRRVRTVIRLGEELLGRARARRLPGDTDSREEYIRTHLFEMSLDYMLQKGLYHHAAPTFERVDIPGGIKTTDLTPRGFATLVYLLVRSGEFRKANQLLKRVNVMGISTDFPAILPLHIVALQGSGEQLGDTPEDAARAYREAIQLMERELLGITIERFTAARIQRRSRAL